MATYDPKTIIYRLRVGIQEAKTSRKGRGVERRLGRLIHKEKFDNRPKLQTGQKSLLVSRQAKQTMQNNKLNKKLATNNNCFTMQILEAAWVLGTRSCSERVAKQMLLPLVHRESVLSRKAYVINQRKPSFNQCPQQTKPKMLQYVKNVNN